MMLVSDSAAAFHDKSVHKKTEGWNSNVEKKSKGLGMSRKLSEICYSMCILASS